MQIIKKKNMDTSGFGYNRETMAIVEYRKKYMHSLVLFIVTKYVELS
jgi:hypothetical protein